MKVTLTTVGRNLRFNFKRTALFDACNVVLQSSGKHRRKDILKIKNQRVVCYGLREGPARSAEILISADGKNDHTSEIHACENFIPSAGFEAIFDFHVVVKSAAPVLASKEKNCLSRARCSYE